MINVVHELFYMSEVDQGAIAIVIFILTIILGVIGFFVKRIFFPDRPKSSSNFIKTRGSISAGGDIIAGDKTAHIVTNINGEIPKNLKTFELHVEEGHWKKEIIDHKDTWICEGDASFQIKIGKRGDKFSESWTKVYPDEYSSYQYELYLLINGVVIKQLIFVSLDAGRIFVPLPKIKGNQNSENEYYWESNSLDFKIGRIVGEYYIYGSLEGIAKRSNIKIIK